MAGIDKDSREELMQRDVLLIATAGASLLNGAHFSPYFEPVFILLKPFIAGTLLSSPLVVLYITSLFCSFLTLMVAGVPAALYERWRGLEKSSTTSLVIWLAGTVALAVPAFISAAVSR
jgi:hypothetical protein